VHAKCGGGEAFPLFFEKEKKERTFFKNSKRFSNFLING